MREDGAPRIRRLEQADQRCADCRRFDGLSWCHRWNLPTEAGSPICDQFRQRPRSRDGGGEPAD
ncbi:MAG TPA: hypothetical protein VNI34_02270 [Candidatus Nitrosotalea sp.]|nr:hypothetical protein [Candidatus Nitrosotalea sp.]